MRRTNLTIEDALCDWRETFLHLDDKQFFALMRLYLGQIKTPYNKQKLLEQLEGFLRREETQKNIVALLSEKDILVLSAIKFLSCATLKNFRIFFGSDFAEKKILRQLQKLKSRLLIYESSNESRYDLTYKIMPLLQNPLNDILSFQKLFPAYEKKIVPQKKIEFASAEFVAAFLCYIAKNKNFFKLDGSFKKRSQEELKKIFSCKQETLHLFLQAFLNLGLVQKNGDCIELNFSQINAFSKLQECEQILYLLCAIPAGFSKERIATCSQIFWSALCAIPKGGFEQSVFLRYAQMLALNNSFEHFAFAKSRFSKILQSYNSFKNAESEPENLKEFFERLLKYAELFGIILSEQVFEDGKKNSCCKVIFKNENFFEKKSAPKGPMIKIDGAFGLTLMRGFEFKKIFPLVKFADIVQFDAAIHFELNKDSAMRAFDCGMDAKKIASFLKEALGFFVPEPLEVSIKEWQEVYKSVSLYKGFVLQLDKKTAVLAERNSLLKKHIFLQLAPNVFLLDLDDESQIFRLLQKCGIENAGKIKTPQKEEAGNFEFPSIFQQNFLQPKNSKKEDLQNANEKNSAKKNFLKDASLQNKNCKQNVVQNLYKKIDALKISDLQKDALREIAAAKMLVNSSQLCSPAIPAEKKSARGMDYQGKIYVIEQAVRHKEKILFRLSKNAALEIATPISIEKTKFQDGVYLNLIVCGEEKMYSVGKIEFVQRLAKFNVLE